MLVKQPLQARMGHAGAIVTGGSGTASDKIEAMQKAGLLWQNRLLTSVKRSKGNGVFQHKKQLPDGW